MDTNMAVAQSPAMGSVMEQPTTIYASRSRRFGTFLIDYLCYFVICFVIGAVLGALFGPAAAPFFRGITGYVFAFLVFFGFYCLFEGLCARTPGKFALGTMVVNESGGRPSFNQVMGRTAMRMVPFEPFSFFGKVGWHDSVSKTRVVMISQR